MTQPKPVTRQAQERRATSKNPAERRARREEFVIRTLKPITPPSLVVHRRLRARVLFALPLIVSMVGIALVVLHSLLPLGPVVLGAAALVGGAIWTFSNFLLGSPRQIIENLKPAERDHRGLDQLINLLEGLCVENGLATPQVRVIGDLSVNALVIGWNESNATLVVTAGLLESCTRIELEGVIAHELAHIKRGDMRDAAFVSVACGMVSLISARSAMLASALLSPSREANADIGGVAMTRYPPGLIQALSKISGLRTRPENLSQRVARLSAPCWFDALEEANRRRVVTGDLDVRERIGLLAEL